MRDHSQILPQRWQESLIRRLELIDAGKQVFQQKDATRVSVGDSDHRGVRTHQLNQRIDLRGSVPVTDDSRDGGRLTLRQCWGGQGGGGQNRTCDLDKLLSHC